jgi:hypothetical protein
MLQYKVTCIIPHPYPYPYPSQRKRRKEKKKTPRYAKTYATTQSAYASRADKVGYDV